MAVKPGDITFSLTAMDYNQPQTNLALSIGGYPSTTPTHPSTTLSANAGIDDSVLSVVNGLSLQSPQYVSVGQEIIKVQPFSGNTLNVLNRQSIQTPPCSHLASQPVFGVGMNDLFSGRFNSSLTQYRCIAITNTNSSAAANNVQVYLKQLSSNPNTSIQIAVEEAATPFVQPLTCVEGSTMSLTVSTLDGFVDNVFANCVLQVLTGDNEGISQVVSSYDSETQTFVVSTPFAVAINPGDMFCVFPAPAQRSHSAIVSPVVGTSRVTVFSAPTSAGIDINVSGSRVNGSSLLPGDVTYVWLSRSLTRNTGSFNNNGFVLAVRYTT